MRAEDPERADTHREALLRSMASAVAVVATEDGPAPSAVEGVYCMRQGEATRFDSRRWQAALAFVLQGVKALEFGGAIQALSPGHYTLTPLPLPVRSRFAEASAARPFLCLLVAVEPATLAGIVSEMEAEAAPSVIPSSLIVGVLSPAALEAAAALTALLSSPEAGRILGPGAVKALLYHALRGPEAAGLRRLIRAGGGGYSVARVIHRIGTDLQADLDVAALASEAGMSRTRFFAAFKRVTATTPVQYQKQLRLLEAQRLMVEVGETAEAAGYAVGYRSPSQFSREYARMFSAPPARHACALRAARDPRQGAWRERR